VSRAALAAVAGTLLFAGGCRQGQQASEGAAPASSAQAASPAAATHFAADRFYLVRAKETRSVGKKKMRLLAGFGVSVVRREHRKGRSIAITQSGLEVPSADLKRAKPITFRGAALSGGRLDVAWVRRDRAKLLAQADEAAPIRARKKRLAKVKLLRRDGPEGFWQVQGGWMRAEDLAVPKKEPPPEGVAAGQRWIDIDLRSQTLVAYQGEQPVFATLISGGVGAPGTTFATPLGVHRIRSKLLAARMDNLEHPGVVPYFYEEVPFSQYFGRYALHGIYWHDRLGQPMSHGCVNLSMADAEFLFAFTEPRLPAGQKEVGAPAGGTVVQVR
jgi:hypothetical protein